MHTYIHTLFSYMPVPAYVPAMYSETDRYICSYATTCLRDCCVPKGHRGRKGEGEEGRGGGRVGGGREGGRKGEREREKSRILSQQA